MSHRNVAPDCKPFAGYVRVSRVNGRSGESFISPEAQRESIERTARLQGLTLAEVVEELDVSGGKNTEARELGRLVQAVKDGEYGGIVVWNVKRYSRAWLDGITVFDDLVRAGGRLVAEDFSHVGLYARSVLSFILESAEEERRQKAETWQKATCGAAERGITVGPARFGYVKDDRRRARKDAETCAVIERAYRCRFNGGSWSEVAAILAETGKAFTTTSARNLLGSKAYMGYLPCSNPEHEHGHFHKSLVVIEPSVWDAVNTPDPRDPKTGKAGRRDGGGAPLAKLLVCSGCGRSLTIREDQRGGKVYRYYRCTSGKSFCSAPIRVQADKAEMTVLDMLFDGHFDFWTVGKMPDAAKVSEAEHTRNEAASYVRELDEAIEEGQRISPSSLAKAQERLDKAQARLDSITAEAPRRVSEDEMRETFEAASLQDRRAMIRRFLGTITVEKSGAFVPEKIALDVALAAVGQNVEMKVAA
jgi:site-specific DNA recombinase